MSNDHLIPDEQALLKEVSDIMARAAVTGGPDMDTLAAVFIAAASTTLLLAGVPADKIGTALHKIIAHGYPDDSAEPPQ